MTLAQGFHAHLVSNSTGATLHALAHAALLLFPPELEVRLYLSVFVNRRCDLDEALHSWTPVIGLTASPSRLAQVRSHQLASMGQTGRDYSDLDRIRREVADARLFFQRHGIPNVIRRSVEETATEILAELRNLAVRRDATRRDLPDSVR